MENNIKKEIRSFALKLRRDLIKREKYFSTKTESWQESVTGDRYLVKTEILNELWQSIETATIDLDIKIPYLK